MRSLNHLRKTRILFADADVVKQVEVRDWLEGLFAEILVADTAAEALSLTKNLPIQALITGMKLPDRSGMALVEDLRERFPGLPVIFIGTSTSTEDLLAAIKVRPIDYLLQPVDWPAFKEALKRLAAHIGNRGEVLVRLSDGSYYCTVDGSLMSNGQTLSLTKQERRLIETLIARRGQWVHSERLLMAIYDDPELASESGLKSLIMRLRRKLGREVIVNGYGLGYRLQKALDD